MATQTLTTPVDVNAATDSKQYTKIIRVVVRLIHSRIVLVLTSL